MNHDEEPELIERAQAGDHHAFRKLVEMHQRFVYSVAFRFTCNRAEAEDITQEVFVKLWRNLGKYRREIKLTTWVYRIIVNHCLDYLKSASRKQQTMSVEIKWNAQITDETSLEKQLDDRELVAVVTALAKKLTPKQQTVFILRDLEGLDVDAVCELVGMSPEKLKSNLFHARQKIREDLIRYYKENTKDEVNEL